jgi:hypothetical protein
VKGLKRQALAACEAALAPLGFAKWRQQVFATDLEPGVRGLVGLGVALKVKPGSVAISPTVAVRHEQVAQLEEQFTGRAGDTLSCPLYKLLPGERPFDWIFDPGADHQAVADQMAAAIRDYGIPFMRRYLTLESVAEGLAAMGKPTPDRRRNLALLHALLGDADRTRELLEPELEAAYGQWNVGQDDARSFLDGFADRFGIHVER